MLISYVTATVCCIYSILKVIGVAGYQVGIFPDTYRYLQAQKQQRQVLLVHMVKKKSLKLTLLTDLIPIYVKMYIFMD